MKKFLNILILVLTVSLTWQLYRAGKLAPMGALLSKAADDLAARFAPKPESPLNEPLKAVAMADRTPIPDDLLPDPEPKRAAPKPEVIPDAPTDAVTPAPASTTAATVTASTSAPEAPVDLSSLERRFWPKQVKLTKAVQFVIASNGKEIGRVAAPIGMPVKVLDIRGSQLEVEMATGSVSRMVLATDTDFQERVRDLKALMGDGTAAAKPAATASSTPWTPKYSATHK